MYKPINQLILIILSVFISLKSQAQTTLQYRAVSLSVKESKSPKIWSKWTKPVADSSTFIQTSQPNKLLLQSKTHPQDYTIVELLKMDYDLNNNLTHHMSAKDVDGTPCRISIIYNDSESLKKKFAIILLEYSDFAFKYNCEYID